MKIRVVLVAVALAVAGCSSEQNNTASSSTATAVPSSKGTVNLGQYELAPPEIPAQREPRVVEGQAVKRPDNTDVFYADGAEVIVLCRTWGEDYPDPANAKHARHDWYQIAVTHLVPGYLQAAFVDIENPVEDCR